MAIEFGSKEAERVLRRAYLKENKQDVIDLLKGIYIDMLNIDIEINDLQRKKGLMQAEAALIRRQHGITVEDEMMMV